MASRKSIGSLVAKLILMDGDFTTKLQSASKKTAEEGKKMEASFSQMGVVATAAFATAASAAMGVFAYKIKDATDKTADFKRQVDRLGIGAQTWATYDVAATKVGTTLGTVETAMQSLAKAGNEASLGDMSKLAAFDKLNIDVAKFVQMSPDDKFRSVVAALNEMPNSAQAAAVGQEVLGTSLKDTFAIMQMGSEEMATAAQKAEDFGLALSNIDAQKVLDASNGMKNLNQAMEGLWRQLSIQLAPALSEVSSLIVKQINEWGGIKAVSRTVFDGIATGAAVALHIMDGFEFTWHMMKAGFYGIASVAGVVYSGVIAGFELISTSAAKAINILIDAHNKVAGSDSQWERFATDMTWTNAMFETAMENGKTAAAEYGKAMAVLDKPPATDRVINWLDHTEEQWTEIAVAEQKAKDESKKYGEQVVSQFDKAAQAITKVKMLLLSLDAVATKGGHSVNAMLAKKAQRYQERAEVFEARGQFGLSDQYRAMSHHFASLVKRRQQTEDMQIDAAQTKSGPVNVVVTDEQRAVDLHRQAKRAFDQKRFTEAAKLDQQAMQLDRVNNARKAKAPPAAQGDGRAPNDAGAVGTNGVTAPATAAKTRSPADADKDTLIAQITTLIETLNGLPDKIGVA